MFGDIVEIFAFDGQTVWADAGASLFEVGNFLGGGAAGMILHHCNCIFFESKPKVLTIFILRCRDCLRV